MKALVRSVSFITLVSLTITTPVSAQSLPQMGVDIDGEAAGDWSGSSVSLSADGTRVAVGARLSDGNGTNSGHVRIFEYASGSWSQLGADIDGEAAGDESGSRVSLSADGTRVAVGAPQNGGNGTDSGHVRIFEYVSGSWSQLGADIDGEAGHDGSGRVSLSADGTRVAVGAHSNDGNGMTSGHVRIFEYVSGSWSQLGADIDGEAAGDQSGGSVSLSADGTRVAVGAIGNDGNGAYSGHVRIFEYASGSWSQLGADIDGEAAGDMSGRSVSLSADGTRVAVGALLNSGNGSSSGHVRIFEYASGSWGQLGADIDGEAAGDRSGDLVSLSMDGTRVAVAAPKNNGNGTTSGHVRIFEYASGSWSQLGADIDGEAAGDESGYSVSLIADGTRVAVAAPRNDGNGTDSGHIRIFGVTAIVNISVVGSGVVNPSSGTYYFGTNLLLSATPDAGWLFVDWSGDLVGDYTTASTNLIIDGSKSITATFSDDADGDGILNTNETALGTNPRESDTDHDGLSDPEELYTYSTDPLIHDMDSDGLSDGEEILIYYTDPELRDSDLDGFDDGYEVSTGYDPATTNSTPELYSYIKTSIQFEFNAASGTVYRIEGTEALSSSWETMEDGIVGSGGLVTRHYDISVQSNKFFRAKRD